MMKDNPETKKTYWFTCDICDNHKQSQVHYSKVNGLGINPHKLNKICSTCYKKVDLIKEKADYEWE